MICSVWLLEVNSMHRNVQYLLVYDNSPGDSEADVVGTSLSAHSEQQNWPWVRITCRIFSLNMVSSCLLHEYSITFQKVVIFCLL